SRSRVIPHEWKLSTGPPEARNRCESLKDCRSCTVRRGARSSVPEGAGGFYRKMPRLYTPHFILFFCPSLSITEGRRRSCLKTSTCVWRFRSPHATHSVELIERGHARLPPCCTGKCIRTAISGS